MSRQVAFNHNSDNSWKPHRQDTLREYKSSREAKLVMTSVPNQRSRKISVHVRTHKRVFGFQTQEHRIFRTRANRKNKNYRKGMNQLLLQMKQQQHWNLTKIISQKFLKTRKLEEKECVKLLTLYSRGSKKGSK